MATSALCPVLALANLPRKLLSWKKVRGEEREQVRQRRSCERYRSLSTPVDVYDNSSESPAGSEESSCSDSDSDDLELEISESSSTCSDDDGDHEPGSEELSGNRVVNLLCLSKLIANACRCWRCGGRLGLREQSRLMMGRCL